MCCGTQSHHHGACCCGGFHARRCHQTDEEKVERLGKVLGRLQEATRAVEEQLAALREE